MLKDNFDNWRVGMLVYLKGSYQPMTVTKFLMDDFSDQFCDRLECIWNNEDGSEKCGIFNYNDILITGIHAEQDDI